ncbi:MAG: ABC transporter permease [Candidatus Staskawiczbacteria bacterium]|nr:ABC transporter permease [Candidatus Staskawiczbacteria bacterium]
MKSQRIKQLYKKIRSIFGLSFTLAKANFKLRNEGSYLGILWYLLNPLLLFLIILFIKGVAFSESKIEFYPIYLLFGIVMSNLFTSIAGTSINSISGNSSFITSMKIEYEPFVLSNILQFVFSHLFEVALIVVFMVFFKIPLIGIVYYFIILFFFLIFMTGVSLLFSTIGTYVSDFANIWAFASQLIFFITPTFYTIKPSDPNYFANLFNPLFYFLDVSRQIVVYQKLPETWMMLVAVGISLGFLAVGLFVFEKFKNKFAELV